MRTRSLPVRLVAAALAASQSTACVMHTWAAPSGLSPQQYVSEARPSKARFRVVGSPDTIPIEVTHPAVRGDSLTFDSSPWDKSHKNCYAWSEIRDFEARRVDTGRTLLLNGVAVAFVVGIAVVASHSISTGLEGFSFGCIGC